MENWDHIIFPTLNPSTKNFQNIFDKKINFSLKCSSQCEKPFNLNLFHGQTARFLRWKGAKISTLIFEAKYYLVLPK